MPTTADPMIEMPGAGQMTAMPGRYVLWFVTGSWWGVSLEEDELVLEPSAPLPWSAEFCLN